MKMYVSSFLLVVLVMKSSGQSIIRDEMKKICEKYLNSTGRFLETLSTIVSKTQKQFTIHSCNGNIMENIRLGCSNADECHFQEMLGNFKALISVSADIFDEKPTCLVGETISPEDMKPFKVSLDMASAASTVPSVMTFCDKIIPSVECMPCPTCPVPTLSDCPTACNDIKSPTQPPKTTTVTSTKRKTTLITTSTTPTTTANTHNMDSIVDKDKTKDCLQVSDLVIAIILSFIAGVFCTMISVLAILFFRRRGRHRKSDANDDMSVSAGDAQLSKKVVASFEDKVKENEITYESLNRKELDAEKAKTEHVYIGLNTHPDPDNKRVTTNRYENVTQTGVDSNPQRTIDKKEDNVYNTLEINTHTEDTYTGLTERENENQHQQSNDQDISETQNNSSEAHYFILHDETNCNRNNRNSESNVQEKTNEVSENKADNTTTKENEYFVLQKIDHFDSKIPEETHNDENSVDDSEGAYHILEKE